MSKCKVCQPHANARRATHCPIGLKLFREFEAKAEAYTNAVIEGGDGSFAAKRKNDARGEMEVAQANYRAHTEYNWNPNTGDAA